MLPRTLLGVVPVTLALAASWGLPLFPASDGGDGLDPGARLAAAAPADVGDVVHTTRFSRACPGRDWGTGAAFDGFNLWYTCLDGNPDLLRADARTGQVTASHSLRGGLGAVAYDATRNGLWVGWTEGRNTGEVLFAQLDADKDLVDWSLAFTLPAHAQCSDYNLDGFAYDGTDDSLFVHPDCGIQIHHYATDGTHLSDGPYGNGDFDFADPDCFGSGLALGGEWLYEGSNGCLRIFAVDKLVPSTVLRDFPTSVPDDPGYWDEDLECDPLTFAAEGHSVMWSRDLGSPPRVHAFDIPRGTCGLGGVPGPAAILGGRAIAVRAQYFLGPGEAVAIDTGEVRTTGTTSTERHAATALAPFTSLMGLQALVDTTAPDAAHAEATLAKATIFDLGGHLVEARGLRATSDSDCDGAVGSATIASLSIDGVAVPDVAPAPNTGYDIGGVQVLLNAQDPLPGYVQGLAVAAVRVAVPGLGNLTLAAATSHVEVCAW